MKVSVSLLKGFIDSRLMISSFPDGQESGGCKFQDAFFGVDLPDDDLDDLELEVELDIGPSITGINA